MVKERLEIDGAQGEGGGQILRSALALSMVTGRPFRIERIRAAREKPGLMRQHLTAVQAAASVSGARVSGADPGSTSLEFSPSRVRAGEHRFAVGTAGSATLVLQTVLPALLTAAERSTVTIDGGTHNPYAPPFDFLSRSFVPALRRMGAAIELTLDAHGFYPAGGGRITIIVEPCSTWRPLVLNVRGETRVKARGVVAALPEVIAKRELGTVRQRLKLDSTRCHVETVRTSAGPGNVVIIEMESADTTEVVTGFGMKGISAEQVANAVCDEAEEYLHTDVPVGKHLADQLLLPMAIAAGGTVRTLKPTAHTTTNADVIRKFVDVPLSIEREQDDVYRIAVGQKRGWT